MTDFAQTIAAAYAAEGPAIDLGRGVHDGALEPRGRGPGAAGDDEPPRAGRRRDRHRQDEDAAGHRRAALGRRACRCFVADVKGDVSGLAAPGDARAARRSKRAPDLGVPVRADGFPVEFLSLGGIGPGVPVRATVSDFGPAAAGQGARRQRDAGAVPRARLPLRRRQGPAAAGPLRPARAADLPGLRRGQGRARGHRRPVGADRRRAAARARRRSRTAAAPSSSASRSSTSPTCCAPRPTAAASSRASSCPPSRTSPRCARPR